MNKPLPWNVKGVGFDAREAARLAAKRAGVPLGDWLNSVIAQRAAELGVQVEDVEAEDRLDAIASRLSEKDAESSEALVRPEREMRRYASAEAAADDRRAAAPVPAASITSLNPLQARFATPQSAEIGRVAGSATGLSRRSESSQSAQLRAAPPSRSANDQLDDRLNSILAKLNRSFEAAAEISEAAVERKPAPRQADNKAKAASSPPDPDLAPRHKAPEPRPVVDPTPRVEMQHPVSFAELQNAFKSLAEKLEAQLAETGSGQPGSGQSDRRRPGRAQAIDGQTGRSDEIRGMQRELAQLAAHVADLTPQRSLASLEAAVRDLAGRVDLSRLDGVQASVLAPVERLGQEMREAIRSADASAAVDAVRRDVKTLAAKLDAQTTRGSDDRALEGLRNDVKTLRDVIVSVEKQLAASERLGAEIGALGERIDTLAARSATSMSRDMARAIGDIRDLLQDFRPGAELSAIDRKIDHLSARIETIAETRKPEALFDDMARQIDRAHEVLVDRLNSRGAPTPNLGGIEDSLDALSAKIDTMSRSSHDVNALYGLVGNLADRMQDARDPQADSPALAALQAQIAQLVERLDRSDSGNVALQGLERLIGDLFLQIEQSRNVAIDAAENAARAAAQDTLRAAMDNPALNGAELTMQTGLDVEQVSQELSELRRVQEASDRRITTTLTALNTTLERLVDHMVTPAVAAKPAPTAVVDDAPQSDRMLRRKRRTLPEAAPSEPSLTSELPPFDPEQFLLEPGSLARATERDARMAQGAGTAPTPNVTSDSSASVAPLIAAARRAAQAAQESALEASLGSSSGADKDGTGAPSKTKSFFANRRRPLLLALAGVVLLLGTLQIVRLSTDQSGRDATAREPAANAPAPIDPTPAPAPVTPKLDKGAALESTPDGQDPMTTGTVAPRATAAIDPAPAAAPPKAAAVPPQDLAALAGMTQGLRDLAGSGNAAAQFEVAVRLSDGKGVTRDAKAAAAWFERAAKQGLAPAQYRLGSIYEKGVGVSADPALATAWYEKAASQGNIRAMHNLAVMSAEGAGSKPDYGKAVSWFTKAASYGVRDSQYNLAVLFARGLGVPQNLGQSYAWFTLAAQQGDADAVAKRDAVAAKLDAKALGDAKAMVTSFHALSAEPAANDVPPPPGGWDAAAPAKTASAPKTEARISSM